LVGGAVMTTMIELKAYIERRVKVLEKEIKYECHKWDKVHVARIKLEAYQEVLDQIG
jgi:hypothetical protein